jgi:hypothetical protein
MSTTTTPQASKWRTLSADEFAASADAKLRGALAVIFWSATAMVVTLLLMLAAVIAFGGFLPITMFWQMMFADASSVPSLVIARFQAVQQALFALWAVVFVVMTLMRRPSTPTAASVLMVIWAVSWIAAEIATHYLSANSFDLVSPVALLLPVIIEIVLVSAFCGYMSDGRRPNAYFRKRVRV